MNCIKQLTIGGFQVFTDPVIIPLGPLTLLYGPNSAGKSAILDAILALSDLCDLQVPTDISASTQGHRIGSILREHWRRESTRPTELAKELKLGAIIRLAGTEWAKAGFAFNR